MTKVKPPALICMGAGKSQVELIKKIKKLGFKSISIDINKNSQGFKFSEIVINKSTHDFEHLEEELKNLRNDFDILGIVNRSSGPPVITAAKIANFLGMETISVSSATTVINKHLLYNFCKLNSIDTPKTLVFNSNMKINPEINYPALIKPSLSLVGKSGISLILNEDQIKHGIKSAASNTINNKILFQEYIPGIDISFIAFVKNNLLQPICYLEELNSLNISNKIYGKGFKTLDHNKYSNIISNLNSIAHNIIKALNIHHSPLNLSFRFDGNILYLIEIHLDIGGDLLMEQLLPAALNIDYAEVAIKQSVMETSFYYEYQNPTPTAILFSEGDELISNKDFNILRANSYSELDNFISTYIAKNG